MNFLQNQPICTAKQKLGLVFWGNGFCLDLTVISLILFSGAPPGGGPHGMPSQPPPTSASAQMNALTSAQHYAALTQQYHAAAAMQAFTGSNPMAAQAQAAQLLAHYQQSMAASAGNLTPDMILKQYPHLTAAGLAAPPHMLGGRSPATDHMHMMQARERELQAERERQQR